MSKQILLSYFLLNILTAHCQNLTGTFNANPNQTISLYVFEGSKDSVFDSRTIDSNGHFSLSIPKKYCGTGILYLNNKTSYNIILNEKDVSLKLINNELTADKHIENKTYLNYLRYYNKKERLLSAWNYLSDEYNRELSKNKKQLKTVNKQIKKISLSNQKELNLIPKNSVAKKIISIQKLIQSTTIKLNEDVNNLSPLLKKYRAIDYSDDTLYNSSFFKKAIETQYWMLENSGLSNDSMYSEINKSTDIILKSLENNEEKYNSTINFIFDLLEKHSLFQASEYLALKVLNSNSCQLNAKLSNQLEYYRKMKVGNTTPDLVLEGGTIKNGKQINEVFNIKQLSTPYKLIVFGASWCPKCNEEMEKMISFYNNWQEKNVEVVFIALENNIEEFVNFVKPFPWVSSSTFKGWDAKAAKDYFIHSTPTLIMVDQNNKILKKPISIEHANAWINYNL